MSMSATSTTCASFVAFARCAAGSAGACATGAASAGAPSRSGTGAVTSTFGGPSGSARGKHAKQAA